METPKNVLSGAHRKFTDSEIRDVFRRLGLDDPATQERLRALAAAQNGAFRTAYWIETDSGTNSLSGPLTHA